MKRTYKLIASRGDDIVFDDRVHADTPRHARQEMKKLLGLDSLSGIVYSITEIPMDLIRKIVDTRFAELTFGESIHSSPDLLSIPLQTLCPADVEALVMERLQPILRRLAALEQLPDAPPRSTRFDPLAILPELAHQPDWNLVKRHFRRYGDPRKTAAKYGLNLRALNTRARLEGWL
jgi:hypothetical protein